MNYFQSPDDEETSSDDFDRVFTTNRSCTDLIALVLLIVLLVVFVSLHYYDHILCDFGTF